MKETENSEPLAIVDDEPLPIFTDKDIEKLSAYQEKESDKNKAKFYRGLWITLLIISDFIVIGFSVQMVYQLYEIHPIAGYVVGALLVIFLLFITIFFIVKITKMKTFMIDTSDEQSARASRKHNRALRKEIASNILDLNKVTAYLKPNDDKTGAKLVELRKALEENNDMKIAEILQYLYTKGEIKKTANRYIWHYSVKCGVYTAICQNGAADSAIVASMTVKMMSDLIYLYGFRPTDRQMVRLCMKIIRNVCVAAGLNSIPFGQTITSEIKGMTFVTQAISSLVNSGLQGLINGSFIYFFGQKTVSVLLKQFNVAQILELPSESREMLEIQDAEKEELQKEIKLGKNSKEAEIKDMKA